jgi:hypothetical protein
MAWNAAGIQCGLIFSKIPVSVDFCFTFHQVFSLANSKNKTKLSNFALLQAAKTYLFIGA